MLATKFLVLVTELVKLFRGDLIEAITKRRFPGLERDELGLGGAVAGPHVRVGLDRQVLGDQRPFGFPQSLIFFLQTFRALDIEYDGRIVVGSSGSPGFSQLIIDLAQSYLEIRYNRVVKKRPLDFTVRNFLGRVCLFMQSLQVFKIQFGQLAARLDLGKLLGDAHVRPIVGRRVWRASCGTWRPRLRGSPDHADLARAH